MSTSAARDLVKQARTPHPSERGDRVYVLCACGHKCYGEFYGYAYGGKGDAWAAFRRHFEHAHGPYPFPRPTSQPTSLEQAVRHVLRYGKLGKQSQRRLKEALNG